MRKQNKFFLGVFIMAVALGACSKDDGPSNGGDGNGNGQYILAVRPISSDGVADYLLTAEGLDEGTLSTEGNGIEQDGTWRYYVTHNNRFFSMLYGQGNPGAVTTYELDNSGQLARLSNFQTETVQAFAPVDNDILMIKIPRSGDANALWYRVDSEQLLIVGEGQTNIESVAANGERAHFTWITQVGNKVFAPYMSIKGCCNDVFGTSYPDSAWIAVYSYPDMNLEKVIKDDRISYIGRYFSNGLAVVESGDVYATSGGLATTSGQYTSTKPAAIVRIRSGETEFDQDYFFDISEASGGAYITDQTYIGNGNFILTMGREKGAYAVGREFAVANVYDQTFSWISGTPNANSITEVTNNNYAPGDGNTAYIGITTSDGNSYVYRFDASSAQASQGLRVEGGTITAISKLDPR